MRRPLNYLLILAVGLVSTASGVAANAPEETAPGETNKPLFTAKALRENVTPNWQIARGLLAYGGSQLTFLVPDQYSMRAERETMRVLLDFAGDAGKYGAATIEIQFYPRSAFPTNELNLQWLTEKVKADQPDAAILGDFTVALGDTVGPGLEVRINRAGSPPVLLRHALVTLSDSVVEIKQATHPAKAEWHQGAFTQLATSFRLSPAGSKPEFRPLSLE